MEDNEYKKAIIRCREITKLQKGTKWRTCKLKKKFFFKFGLLFVTKKLNKIVKFLLIIKRL